jgi:hypothetical protein
VLSKSGAIVTKAPSPSPNPTPSGPYGY